MFGGLVALDDVAFHAATGETLGLIGPNGAGKTTAFNSITGVVQPTAGSIRFGDLDLLAAPAGPGRAALLRGARALGLGDRLRTRLPAHRVAEQGIARTFQSPALFPSLSVLDNVLLGRHTAGGYPLIDAALTSPRARAWEREARGIALALLARLGLRDLAGRPAGALTLGVRKRVELARALAGRPRLLLMDEPAAGLTHEELLEFADLLRELREEHRLTILLVEHHIGLVNDLCDRVVVLDFGRVIAAGPPAEVARDPAVIAAYLGVED